MYAIIKPLALARMIRKNIAEQGVDLVLRVCPREDMGAIEVIPGDMDFREFEDMLYYVEVLTEEWCLDSARQPDS